MKRLALSVAALSVGALSVGALGMVGAGLPMAAPASASSPVAEEPDFSGYSSSAWAAPVRLEVYDPAIPIPSSPQFEVKFGYSMVEADSSSSHGRASWVWPGDPVGEGLKTFVEQMGLPPKLGEKGYPLQVNAISPGGPPEHKDEPLPGTIMRSSADDTGAIASTGFSPDGESQDSEEGAAESPLAGLLGLLGAQPTAGDEPTSAPGIPAPLEALVDFGGYQSGSRNTADDVGVQASSRSALGEVRLLGGIIQLSGISARSVASSDGEKGVATGRSTYGSMTIAGKEFSIGPDGVVAAGKPSPLPGLPDDPGAALAKLGLKIVVPKARLTREGDKAVSVVEGLRIELDTAILRPVLSALPLDKLVALLPDQAGQLKSVLSGVTSLAPRFVITLGVATSTIDTVQAVPVEPPPVLPEPAAPAPSGTGTGTGTGSAPGVVPPAVEPPGEAAPGDLDGVEPVSAGLPPLFSIPGVLFLGALALAVVVGSYLRRMGALALGSGTCLHGLDSGLPDLRKA